MTVKRLLPADGEAELGVGEDTVFLEGAGAAAVATKASVSGVEAKPCVARSRKLMLVRRQDKIDRRIR